MLVTPAQPSVSFSETDAETLSAVCPRTRDEWEAAYRTNGVTRGPWPGKRPPSSLETEYPTFEGASKHVLHLLEARLRSPARTPEAIAVLRQPIDELLSLPSESFAKIYSAVKNLELNYHVYSSRYMQWNRKPLGARDNSLHPLLTLCAVCITQSLRVIGDEFAQADFKSAALSRLKIFLTRYSTDPIWQTLRDFAPFIRSKVLFSRNAYQGWSKVCASDWRERQGFDEMAPAAPDISGLLAAYSSNLETKGGEKPNIRRFSSTISQGLTNPLSLLCRIAALTAEHGRSFAGFANHGQARIGIVKDSLLTLNLPATGVLFAQEEGEHNKTIRQYARYVLANQAGLPVEFPSTLPVYGRIFATSGNKLDQAGSGRFMTTAGPLVSLWKKARAGDIVFIDDAPRGATHEELSAVFETVVKKLIQRGVTVMAQSPLVKKSAAYLDLPVLLPKKSKKSPDKSSGKSHEQKADREKFPRVLVEYTRWWQAKLAGKTPPPPTGKPACKSKEACPTKDGSGFFIERLRKEFPDNCFRLPDSAHTFLSSAAGASAFPLNIAVKLSADLYLREKTAISEQREKLQEIFNFFKTNIMFPPYRKYEQIKLEHLDFLMLAEKLEGLLEQVGAQELIPKTRSIKKTLEAVKWPECPLGTQGEEEKIGALQIYGSAKRIAKEEFSGLLCLIDVTLGIAQHAQEHNLIFPQVSETFRLGIMNAAPFLQTDDQGQTNGTPLDFQLSDYRQGALIIGPQSSGKTVATRTIAYELWRASELGLPGSSSVHISEPGTPVYFLTESKKPDAPSMAKMLQTIFAQDLFNAVVVLDELKLKTPELTEAFTLALIDCLHDRKAIVICNTNFRRHIPRLASDLGMDIYTTIAGQEDNISFTYQVSPAGEMDIQPDAPWIFHALRKDTPPEFLAEVQQRYAEIVEEKWSWTS